MLLPLCASAGAEEWMMAEWISNAAAAAGDGQQYYSYTKIHFRWLSLWMDDGICISNGPIAESHLEWWTECSANIDIIVCGQSLLLYEELLLLFHPVSLAVVASPPLDHGELMAVSLAPSHIINQNHLTKTAVARVTEEHWLYKYTQGEE